MGRVLNTNDVVRAVLTVGALGLGAAACGSDGASTPTDSAGGGTEQLVIVVTTNILGDVVTEAVGDQAQVEVIMPLGSDPHDFAPSARQAESMENADLLVVNGAGFEEGMLDIISNVSDSGTPIFSFADQIDLLTFDGTHDHAESDDHGSDGEHAGEGTDPHLWTDPTRIATAVESLGAVVADLDGVDPDRVSSSFADYLAELSDLDASMQDTLSEVPQDQRVLVTNHEVFGYFADRFDFQVVGAIIPSLTTNAEPSASDVEELASLIEADGIGAVFAETTQSSTLADALADEVGGTVEVVELFSESLGEDGSGAETYVGMMQRNAELVAGALAP